MVDIQIEEYRGPGAGRKARQSNLFSLTNGFSFSDPCNGHLQSSLAVTDNLGIKLSRVRSTGHQIDLTELHHSTILLPMQGRLEARSGDTEHSCRRGDALLFGPNRRTTRVVSETGAYFEASVVMLPTRQLMADVDRHAVEVTSGLLETGITMHQADARCASFLKFCEFLSAAFMNSSAALGNQRHMRGMEALLIELYGEFLSQLAEESSRSTPPSAGARYVVKAEAYMRANLHRPLTVAEVAAELGVSPRSLQLAFREVRSAAPREILALMRLHLVHERLKSDKSRAGVTDIALECGVANIGRFARFYREVYGEKPSATRRKARHGSAGKQ